MNCSVCLLSNGDCICPECPNCHSRGRPECYKEHTLKLTRNQLLNRENAKLDDLTQKVYEQNERLEFLSNQNEDYVEDWIQ